MSNLDNVRADGHWIISLYMYDFWLEKEARVLAVLRRFAQCNAFIQKAVGTVVIDLQNCIKHPFQLQTL